MCFVVAFVAVAVVAAAVVVFNDYNIVILHFSQPIRLQIFCILAITYNHKHDNLILLNCNYVPNKLFLFF